MPTLWMPTVVIDGLNCLLVLPEINWRQRPKVTHQFLTEHSEGRSGIEARASEHFEVTLALEYLWTLKNEVAQEFIDTIDAMIETDSETRLALPLWPDKKPRADYLTERKWASQHWLNIDTSTGAYSLDADTGLPESVGLAICAPIDLPKRVPKTDLEVDVTLKAEEDSPWESRIEINAVAAPSWDFEINWAQLPDDASRWQLSRRRIGHSRMTARTGQDGAIKRTQTATVRAKDNATVRRLLSFWQNHRGPWSPFTIPRLLAPDGTVQTMQSRFADETLVLEFSQLDEASARIAFSQDLELNPGEPAQNRPSRAYLYKVWWDNAVTVFAWTDWRTVYSYGGLDYQPKIVEHKSSTETLKPGQTDWELLVYDFEGNPLRAFGRLARERKLHIEIRECDPSIANTATLVFVGDIKSAPNKGRIYTAKAALFGAALRMLTPQHFCQQGCNNTLGDLLCGIDIETLRVDGTIAVINGTVVDVTCANADPADSFAPGFARLGTGDDIELRFVLRSEPIAGGQRLTFHRPLWSSVVGTVVALYPGCDQQYEGGCARYGNQGKFFGAPYKPEYIDSVETGFKMKTGK